MNLILSHLIFHISFHPSSSSLKCIREEKIVAHLNINSQRNKFDSLVDQIKGKVDILVISETKLNESFPVGQFKIPGFATPFCRYRNEFSGGIMVFVREDIPAKQISNETLNIEGLFIERIFRKKSGY